MMGSTESQAPPKIVVDGVSKIFGPRPEDALRTLLAGASKQEILEKTGHTVALDRVDLSVRANEIFVVMGLSGSGKSTLVRHLNRLIEPTAGRIEVDGENILELDTEGLRDLRRHKMSMVFQSFALLPHRTVLENVAYGLHVAGIAPADAQQKASEQIRRVGLLGFEGQYPRQLSGGMQQRVGLARAMATDPEILLMDEAFSALDPLIRRDMQDQLLDLQATRNRTIVFITHDLDEALRLGDRIAILKDGALSQVGTPDDILMRPADDYVRRFVRDVNRVRAIRLGTVAAAVPTITTDQSPSDGPTAQGGPVVVVDAEGRPQRLLENGSRGADDASPHCLAADDTIEAALEVLADGGAPVLVVDASGCLVGLVTRETAVRALVPR